MSFNVPSAGKTSLRLIMSFGWSTRNKISRFKEWRVLWSLGRTPKKSATISVPKKEMFMSAIENFRTIPLCKSLTPTSNSRRSKLSLSLSPQVSYHYIERNDCSFYFQHNASLHSLSNPLNTMSPAPATTMHFPTISTLPANQLPHYPYPDSPQSAKTPI